MSRFKRITALIALSAAVFTLVAPAIKTAVANEGPRVHCC
ncbi:MAG: hypothetical protein JWN52_1072 [Actinomycetia bacterium]|jgi:hypothetical protein|nr:hypothetical protein [Actinomycetes bacterium]